MPKLLQWHICIYTLKLSVWVGVGGACPVGALEFVLQNKRFSNLHTQTQHEEGGG